MNFYVLKAVLVATMGIMIVGFHTGSINGMFEMQGFQGSFSELFEQSDECLKDPATGELYSLQQNVTAGCGICTPPRNCGGKGVGASSVLGLMVAISSILSLFGAFFSGWPITVIGRKLTLSISGLLMAVGALLSAVSFHSWLFIVGRGLFGFSKGMGFGLVTLYISEMSPREWRGRLAAMIGPLYGISLIVQFCATCGFSYFCLGWRVSILMQVVLGLVYGVAMLFLPNTPRWLVLQNRSKEAHIILSRINGSHNEVTTLLELEELKSTTTELSKNFFRSFSEQFNMTRKWKYFKRLALSSVMFLVAPIIGNFSLIFSNTFFCKLDINQCVSNIILGICVFIGGVGTSVLIDKSGRKAILLGSSLVLLLLQGFMTALIQIFKLEEETNTEVGYVLTVLFCMYAMIFSGSWLVLPLVISSEIFPVEIRGLNVALSTTVYWVGSTLINQLTNVIIDSVLGIAGYLYILFGITLAAALFVLFTLPETKGVSLEKLDELFEKPWVERTNIVHIASCGLWSLYTRLKATEEIRLKVSSEEKKSKHNGDTEHSSNL